jgi:protein-L-isoaspartate(D-aspartate) O-methyltransferase
MNVREVAGAGTGSGRLSSESRLRAALLHFPLSRFHPAAEQHEAELEQPPEDLAVVTMLEALELDGTERVLEIGSPTAYLTALLSYLATDVYSLVARAEQAKARERELSALGCRNVHVVRAAPQSGWSAGAPYQAIVVGAAAPELPLELVNQLAVNGRLVIAVGDAHAQLLERLHKRHDTLDSETLGACHLHMLEGEERSLSSFPWSKTTEAQSLRGTRQNLR